MQKITLSDYIADPSRRAQLAADTDSSADYLWQIATGWRGKRGSPTLAERIETATGGVVPKEWVIWPPGSAACEKRKRRRKPTPKRALTLPHKAVGKGRARCG